MVCVIKTSVTSTRWLTRWFYTDKINVRDVLEKGLDDLSDLCDVVIEKFTAARDEYHAETKPV